MDCPSCGRPRAEQDDSCPCGYDFEQTSNPDTQQEARDDSEAVSVADSAEPAEPKRRKRKRKKRRKRAAPVDDEWVGLRAQHHMPVLLLLLLYFVTCGIYAAYWFLKRQPFVDRLAARTKIGQTLPMIVLIGSGINLIVSLLVVLEPHLAAQIQVISQLLGLAVGISSLVLAFRVRSALQEHGAHAQPGYDVSAFGTFFLGALYLQYKINELPQQAPIDDLVREFE